MLERLLGKPEAALEKARATMCEEALDSMVEISLRIGEIKSIQAEQVRMVANFEGVDPHEFESP